MEKDCDNWKFSSNINEVISAVLNFLYIFFYEKISHTPKAQKAPKALKALKVPKALKGTKTLRQKHKNANKQINDYFPLKYF